MMNYNIHEVISVFKLAIYTTYLICRETIAQYLWRHKIMQN